MYKIADKVINHKKLVLVLFIIAVVISAMLSKLVDVNYDLMEYLPKDSKSTISLEVMNSEFSKSPPNARVLISKVTVTEAIGYKKQLSDVDGVLEVTWLDDATNIYQPLELIDKKMLNSWYKNENALFTLLIDKNKSLQAVSEVQSIIANKGEMSGDIVDTVIAQTSTGSETGKMLLFILPIILLILLLTTSSWFEPVLFLIAIFASIIINNGTNAFLGEISFITKTTAAILQLAVSMDYSIFLLHRFQEHREKGENVREAMISAMKKSFSSILASGVTTILGFGALIIMRFKIGPDLGIVLSKGIIFSLLSVMFLLPVLTVYTYKLIDKTHHRSFMPSFDKFGKFAVKLGLPVIIIVGILILPSFMAQNKNDFMYGASVMGSASSGKVSKTDELFGKANNMVLLVPKGDVVTEKIICEELKNMQYISSVVSYVGNIGAKVPQKFIPKDKLETLASDNYSRMILTVSTSQESDAAFKAVEEIRSLGEKYYGDNYYLSGGSVNVYDMKNTVIQDNKLVTIVAVIGIGLVLMFTFRSISLPLILLLTIESSVWINLAFPYFAGEKMAYLGFMIISSVQLGATVDYAILFANRYIENRRCLPKKEAAIKTVSDTTGSILTSSGILMLSGFVMGTISTNGVIGQLGTLIARGTLLSASLVLLFLPSALMLLDKVIEKTTLKLEFYKGE
jgi:predicted RND superfamily exporter protein